MSRDKAIVMLSGGLDSATCLYWAKAKFSDLCTITFNYFGRLMQEKRAVDRLVSAAGIKDLIEVDLPFVKEAGDFYSSNLKSISDAEWVSSYVPMRNMIFYSITAHYAEYLGAKWIIGGHNLHDVKLFRDASKDYIDKLNRLLEEGCLFCNGQPYQVLLPLADMDRKQIIKLAMKLKTPIELTWSCHKEENVHCGRCYACKQRLEAFEVLGLKDPAFSSR